MNKQMKGHFTMSNVKNKLMILWIIYKLVPT